MRGPAGSSPCGPNRTDVAPYGQQVAPRAVSLLVLWATVLFLFAAGGGSDARAAAPPATPPCPQVEGWTFDRTFGPLDQGLGYDFTCNYVIPGVAEQLSLNVVWIKPSARDVDMDYSQCGRASQVADYYRIDYSKTHFAREMHTVSGGSAAANAARFRAERERIEKAALVFLVATETLAKSCTKTAPTPPKDTVRPRVSAQRASGVAGRAITFPFSFSDNSGKARIVVTIYRAPNKAKVLFRKDYGIAKSGRYTFRIRVQTAATNLWCVKATDASGNAATACSALVVRR